jgi:hypothetical protein
MNRPANRPTIAPVSDASVWKPADLAKDPSWLRVLSPRQLDEMAQAAARWRTQNISFEKLKKEDVQLPSLMPLVDEIKKDLATRGFVLLRGIPVESYSDEDAGRIYWALGLLLGTGVTQNADGELLCPITDKGKEFAYSKSVEVRNVRGYQSRADLNYHGDPTDVVGLMCLRKAKSGGESRIVSTSAIFNEIVEKHPEHLDVLLRGFHYDRFGEEWPGEAPVSERIPVFVRHADRVSCRYARHYIFMGAAKLNVELTAEEQRALDCFDALARREDMAYYMSFEPGDIQFLNNYTVVHGRSAYEDHPEPNRRRYLYRMWLNMADEAPWSQEDRIMRWARAPFGNLGRNADEWARLQAAKK